MSREMIIKEIEGHKGTEWSLGSYCQESRMCLSCEILQGKLEGYDLAVKEIREWLLSMKCNWMNKNGVYLSERDIKKDFDECFGGKKE